MNKRRQLEGGPELDLEPESAVIQLFIIDPVDMFVWKGCALRWRIRLQWKNSLSIDNLKIDAKSHRHCAESDAWRFRILLSADLGRIPIFTRAGICRRNDAQQWLGC